MTAALGTSPYDAISFILAKKVPHVPFKYVRIAWDTSFLLLGWIAGGNVEMCIRDSSPREYRKIRNKF